MGGFIDKSLVKDPQNLELYCQVNGVERPRWLGFQVWVSSEVMGVWLSVVAGIRLPLKIRQDSEKSRL